MKTFCRAWRIDWEASCRRVIFNHWLMRNLYLYNGKGIHRYLLWKRYFKVDFHNILRPFNGRGCMILNYDNQEGAREQLTRCKGKRLSHFIEDDDLVIWWYFDWRTWYPCGRNIHRIMGRILQWHLERCFKGRPERLLERGGRRMFLGDLARDLVQRTQVMDRDYLLT